MRFLLDENIARSAAKFLINTGADVQYVRDLIPEGSVDPLVAFVAEKSDAILLSHDGDFKKIAPRVPDGQKKRFKTLSKIWLRCEEFRAAKRLEKSMSLIEAEYAIAKSSSDKRMIIWLGESYIRTQR